MPRIFCPPPLASGQLLDLPAGAARHVQVLRMQPGQALTLFDGLGGEWQAAITHMGRSNVQVQVSDHSPVEREVARAVHLALGVPANERMDWLVEKATELGVVSIQPLMTERTVLRLAGERADKKRQHWQAIAVAACEQCGRNRVPAIHPVATLESWVRSVAAGPQRLVLSLGDQARSLHQTGPTGGAVLLLSGPEGGISAGEEALAMAQGFTPLSLGPRVLRAETAPLALLATLTLN
jgi:16S rRNA (uracil1498-N3)-methyltransferase